MPKESAASSRRLLSPELMPWSNSRVSYPSKRSLKHDRGEIGAGDRQRRDELNGSLKR